MRNMSFGVARRLVAYGAIGSFTAVVASAGTLDATGSTTFQANAPAPYVATVAGVAISEAWPRANQTSELRWSDLTLEDRGQDLRYATSQLSLSITLKQSYEATSASVMTLVDFHGTLTLVGGPTFAVEHDNAGTFFARALYVRSDQTVKYLLPASLLAPKSKLRSAVIFSFSCDPELSACTPPQLVFSSVLKSLGRAAVGVQGGETQRMVAEGEPQPESGAACCVNQENGSCRCILKLPCPQNCSYYIPSACLDCLEAFLCNC